MNTDKPVWAEYPAHNQVSPPGKPYICRCCGHFTDGKDSRDHSVACHLRGEEKKVVS